MNSFLTLGLSSLFVVLVSCGPAPQSSPFNGTSSKNATSEGLTLFDPNDEIRFNSLPLEGSVEVSKRFWSGDHWALNRGNINRRWNTPSQKGFETVSPTKDEALLMPPEEISRLAPSEKYDLLVGDYTYPLKQQVAEKANPLAVDWEGIGNGWALASSNHDEPLPKVLTNPDGLLIAFGSDDIKAILSYYYAFSPKLPLSRQLGLRCTGATEAARSPEKCEDDLNAGPFHIALANSLGLRKQSFLADIDRYHEVWNHPFQSYRSEILETITPSPKAPESAVKTVRLKTKVSYVDKAIGHSWGPIKGSYKQVTTNRIYLYDLHLNENGEIIGGDWKSNDKPDFIWSMPAVDKFEGYLKKLKLLVAQ